MLTQQTVTHLRTLRLDGMARAFEEQLTQPVATELAFEDRFGLLVDRELAWRDTRRLERLLRSLSWRRDGAGRVVLRRALRLARITRRGDAYVRLLPVQGARSALQVALRAAPTRRTRLADWIVPTSRASAITRRWWPSPQSDPSSTRHRLHSGEVRTERLGATLASKQFDVDDVRVALGSTFYRVLSLVAKALVEPWGLEAVRQKDHLHAATVSSLGFGDLQKSLAQTLTAMLLVNPDVGDIATASPRVATEAGDDFARVVPNATCQEPSVEIPRRLRVELVDTIGEERLQLLAFGFAEQRNSFGRHDT